jgi:hypothetical protein
MGLLVRPQPVALIMGVLYGDEVLTGWLEPELESEFGEIDARSEPFDFDVTDYYESEMGPGLKRRFYGFKELIDPGGIVDIKVAAMRIEVSMSRDGGRTVNLDPGYMDFNKVVLVSAKFHAQKIYLRKGVYADPTIYYDKGWKVHDWAFPDFRSGLYDDFFTGVRNAYKRKVRDLGGGSPAGETSIG